MNLDIKSAEKTIITIDPRYKYHGGHDKFVWHSLLIAAAALAGCVSAADCDNRYLITGITFCLVL